MLTNTLEEMEKQVDGANLQIANLTQKLQKFEEAVPSELDQEQATVLELLDSVTEVKQEYDKLRKDLQEVTHLQKEMTQSLRYQLRTMNQTFQILKKKIEANPAQFSSALHQHHSSNSKIH